VAGTVTILRHNLGEVGVTRNLNQGVGVLLHNLDQEEVEAIRRKEGRVMMLRVLLLLLGWA
jgi:hypothetical protein